MARRAMNGLRRWDLMACSYQPLFRRGQVVPETPKALGAPEQCGEVRRVDEHDVGIQIKALNSVLPSRGEGVGPVWVDKLTAQHAEGFAFWRCGRSLSRIFRNGQQTVNATTSG